MRTSQLVAFVSLLTALAAAKPLVAERDLVCDCMSPTGCPGLCTEGFLCTGYCGTDTSFFCNTCTSSGLSCIFNADGSCFTVVE
ncbi:hypothetical protein C8R45DRAFT_1219626 [Mycena sanguinolenta]|nr:hypothetical protein C8R45DRAFT_1219626 [Mycena sanguinolenta]